MRKIAMIKAGDRKHPQQIKADSHTHRDPAPTDEKNRETTQVQNDERKNARPFHAVRLGLDRRHIGVAEVRIKPLHQMHEKGWPAAHKKRGTASSRRFGLINIGFTLLDSLRMTLWMQFLWRESNFVLIMSCQRRA